MEASWMQIILAVLSSGGIIGTIISVLIYASGRMDKRRERMDKQKQLDVSQTADLKRLELDEDKSIEGALWRIIEEKNDEIAQLKAEVSDVTNTSSLSRPRVTQIYKAVRLMRKEIDSLNLMILNEEETNVFMRRFRAVKDYLDEIETSLP